MEDDGSLRYQEVELIQSICSMEELTFPDESDPFFFTLNLSSPTDGLKTCSLTFQLPAEYPEKGLEVSVSCDGMSRDQAASFRQALLDYLKGLDEGMMQVSEAFLWAQGHLADFSQTAHAAASVHAAVEAEDVDEYTPATKATSLDLMCDTTEEGQQFLQALESHWGFHNFESINTHPLWHTEPHSQILREHYKEDDTVWEHTDALVGIIYITKDPLKTAGISVWCRTFGWELERAFFDPSLPAEESGWEISFTSNRGIAEFEKRLKQKDLPELLRLGARKLQTRLLEEAGFDVSADNDLDEEVLNTVDDSIRRDLDGKYNANHKFKIITYGRDVNSPAFGAGVVTHPRFNWSALGLTGSGKKLNTKKLDGRATEVQGRTSRSSNFKEWMTEKISMIEEWFSDEENKGASLTVAIYCSKGRHRSVSAAILLRDLIYPNAVCEGHGVVGGALRVR